MAQRRMQCLLAASFLGLAAGCKERSDKPIAGLLAAGAPVLRTEGKEQRPVAVGAQLLAHEQLTATGPAVLEYFGGGLRFLEEGDTLEVGDADEAKLHGVNLPSRRWAGGEVQEAPRPLRIVAARYTQVQVTPPSALAGQGTYSNAEYFVAFFTPNGIQKLGSGSTQDGPRQPLPRRRCAPRCPSSTRGSWARAGWWPRWRTASSWRRRTTSPPPCCWRTARCRWAAPCGWWCRTARRWCCAPRTAGKPKWKARRTSASASPAGRVVCRCGPAFCRVARPSRLRGVR
ncbi:hypothetical protein ACLESD_51845 [Pyxidicoccus sp. 3LFB2]